MASDVVRIREGEIATFDPKKTHEKVSVLKAAVQHAKDMQDWDAGMKAAEWLATEQEDFVHWWDANVTPGRTRKSVPADRGKQTSMKQAEKETNVTNQQVSRWRKQVKRPGYPDRIFKAGHEKAMAEGAQRRSDLQTGEMEWYTPAIYIEAARAVMGGIDLDPASCAMAQETIKAERFYAVEEDGLKQKWFGRVWLNPPYSGKLVKAFADKMVASSGSLTAAVMLTNAYTETSWFHALAHEASAVCFTRGRIKFESPHGEKCAPTNGQSFFYFGSMRSRFSEYFSEFGLVMVKP